MPRAEGRTTRIELRAQRTRAERIRHAARLAGQSLSSFMLGAAADRAEEVIAATTGTLVPSKFFDALWAALDRPPKPSPTLVRRARMKRRVTQR